MTRAPVGSPMSSAGLTQPSFSAIAFQMRQLAMPYS